MCPTAASHPPMSIMGLFFMLARLPMPAWRAFLRFTADSISCFSSWSEWSALNERRSERPGLHTVALFAHLKQSLREISVLPNRQTFKLPSAVSLSLLQLPQKFSDIEVMKPTWPR